MALADYRESIRLNPNNAEAYANRGITYRRIGDYDLALANFDKAIQLDPTIALIYHNRGNTYVDLREFTLALQIMMKRFG